MLIGSDEAQTGHTSPGHSVHDAQPEDLVSCAVQPWHILDAITCLLDVGLCKLIGVSRNTKGLRLTGSFVGPPLASVLPGILNLRHLQVRL
jgi:hypothetical protein